MPQFLTLYHGTSSLFLEDIRRQGLGTIYPLDKLGVHDLFRHLWDIASKELAATDNCLMSTRVTLEPMAQNSVTHGGQNFQYGSAYVSSSSLQAVKYAIANPFGSELLSECLQLLKCLLATHEGRKKISNLQRLYPEIWALRDLEFEPILITTRVEIDNVLSESGGDPADQIEDLNSADDRFDQSFRLKRPLSPLSQSYQRIFVLDKTDQHAPRYILIDLP